METTGAVDCPGRRAAIGSLAALLAGGWAGSSLAKDAAVLRIGVAQEVGSLDLLQNESALSSYSLVFDALVHYGDGGRLEPGLAERWEVSADGKVLTFHLKRDLRFSDGTAFDAAAARWNLLRWIGQPDYAWIGVSRQFKAIEVPDAATLRLLLKAPVPAALAELSIQRPVRFLSPKAVDAKGKQTAPIGTGPWKVAENGRSKTVLVRNDLHAGPKPAFERIELLLVPDELSRVNALKAGDLDVIGGEWVAPLMPSRARSLAFQTGVGVFVAPGVSTVLLGFNGNRGPLGDLRVRRAINLGIDRRVVAKVIYQGYADPAANLFPATIPESGRRLPIPARDVVAAGKALDDAGWVRSGAGRSRDGKPLELELLASDQVLPGARRLAELLYSQLGEIGIAVKVSTLDDATYHDRRQKFDYDLAFFGTYAAPYDPHGTLGAMLVSTADSGPDGKIFVSKTLDGLVQAALDASGDARQAGLQRLYDWMEAQQVLCPLVYPQRIWAYRQRVHGFALPPTEYDIPSAGLRLDG